MKKLIPVLFALGALVPVAGCEDDDIEIDLCSDDLDCDDGFICEITGQDDGVCIEDL
ncbi:MAG: hypothetical protein R3F61_01875 [Myxococcota bacterium]